MRSCFRPRDRDRTTESMEGVWMGYWDTLEGCWAAHKRGLCGYPVNRWSIKRTPNGMKLTGGLPVVYQGRLANLGPFRESFNTRSLQETKRGTSEDIGVSDCKTDNGENARVSFGNFGEGVFI